MASKNAPLFLIYDSAQWCTIAKVLVGCEFAFAFALQGQCIVSMEWSSAEMRGKCVRKAFQVGAPG